MEKSDGEEQLQDSERQYRLLFESNPSPMCVMDVENFVFLAVNEAAVRHYGYSTDEFLKMSALDIRPAEDVPHFLQMIHNYLQELVPSQTTAARHKKKDGTLIDVEVFSQAVTFKGRPAHLLQINDVTVRRQADEALQLLTEVTTAASEAADVHEMVARSLEAICKMKKWQLAQAWFIDEDQSGLFCSHSFYSEFDVPDFRQTSLKTTFERGIGTLGEVWDKREARWVENLQSITTSNRLILLSGTGLTSQFVFPIETQEGKVIAVFEFFAKQTIAPDQIFLRAIKKLQSHLGIVFDRKREQDRMRYHATHDALTGLPNRLLFQDRFSQALAQAHRKNQMLAIFMMDLDNFKTINDALGHSVGDQVLQSLAVRLTKSIREVDTIARMGGDELVVLLPELPHIEDAAKMAQRILRILDPPFTVEGNELHLTASIGIAIFPHDGENSQTLMKNVDVALYRAKEKGRNNYQLYTPSMTAAALARLSMENSLRRAIERNEMLLYYHPEIDLQSGEIIAAEGLIRWQHPEMGLCLPAEFLPLAEETGLIGPIWEWALEHACIQTRQWQKSQFPNLLLTMNVPPSQFQLNSLPQIVLKILTITGLAPNSLELEITEAMARKELFTLTLVGELKAIGVRIALDDFGTGYSSLSYLKELPIDTIKIDPYFIRGLNTDGADDAITRSVISLGHALKVRVVAEGVETSNQINTLRSFGCDAIQGFVICKPLPPENLPAVRFR